MFCDRCGTQLQAGQKFCPSCGRQLAVVAMPSVESRLARHLRLLGILWLAVSAFRLLGAGAVLIVGNFLFPAIGRGWPFQNFLPAMLSLVGGFLLLSAFVGFAAGWGLLERRPWARILTLILAFVALLDPPFGTALGIYTLWVLLPSQAEEEYTRMARAA